MSTTWESRAPKENFPSSQLDPETQREREIERETLGGEARRS